MSIQIVLYASVLFFLSEFFLMLSKRSKNKGTKIRKDKRSLLLFWITIPLSLSAGFFTAKYGDWSTQNIWTAIAGLSLFLIGIIIRWISILQLRKEFTVDVSVGENHQLKKNGIYKRLRHPSYSGLLMICYGLSISMNSLSSMLVICIPITLVLLYRIKTEESLLLKEFGSAYRDYMLTSHKIIPGIY